VHQKEEGCLLHGSHQSTQEETKRLDGGQTDKHKAAVLHLNPKK